MVQRGIVTFTSDFGLRGGYVAQVKGVILGLAPGVSIVDVTHQLGPQNVVEGAFVLSEIVDAFPPGTVHLAVVDPGVGTERRLIAVALASQWFVVPDNGVVSVAAHGRTVEGIWEITEPSLRRGRVSSTFHGRDVLAPAVAHLVLGGAPAELGPACDSFISVKQLHATESDGALWGEVIVADSFGNLITNIAGARVAGVSPEKWTIDVASRRIDGLSRTYGEHPRGSLVALVGSGDWVEIAVVGGNAAARLHAGQGTAVVMRRKA
jgi:S-adenosylmethionine hydrolase